jgi:ligand-binding sensor domain-containing protein
MVRVPWRSRWWRAIAAAVLIAPLPAVAFVFWRAGHAKEEAAAEVLAKSELPFRMASAGRIVAASVEPVSANPAFRDIARYRETIAVSSRAGLFLYGRDGTLLRSFRAGLELPPAELGAMSTGIAAGRGEPELFIATRGEGLLAFNGASFRQMVPGDSSLRIVTAVLVLGSGRLLLGTERHGLLVFDGRTLAPFHARLKGQHITALAGNDGDLWIGTLESGVFHAHGGQLDRLQSLPDPQVLSIEAMDGVVYVGTPLGVVEFREGRVVRTLGAGFLARAVTRRGDALYIGTEDEGIVDVSLAARPAPHVPRDADGATTAILRLANLEGELYAVGEDAVYRYDAGSKRWRRILPAEPPVMADRNVAALALSAGRLWVGYFDRGLDILDAGLTHALHHEDDSLFCINRIVDDPAGVRTAVATANGLVLFDSGGRPRQAMGRKDGLLADHVTDVAFRDGGMVVATPAGLSFVDRAGVRSLYVFHGLVNNHVYTVAARGRQTVAGTLGGLSMLDDDTVRVNYTTANSRLKQNWITALVPVGDEWFAGTYGAGVARLDGSGQWHGFPDLKDGFVVNPNAMAASADRIYAGSLDRGLFIFDRGTGRWSSTVMGLPSKNVTALAATGGYLYVGTDNGLVRIAEGALR